MVYEEKKSGDPDLDDKQPIEHHLGSVVSAGDGVYLTPQGGAVDVNGAHVNLAEKEGAGDNRPAPGDVATEASGVQTYKREDLPENKADAADVKKIAEAQAAVIQNGIDQANGVRDNEPAQTENPTADTAPAQTATGSTKSTTAGKTSTK